MREVLTWLRSALLAVLAFALALYFLVAFGQQAWRARQLEAQVASQKQALAELVAKRESLARELESLEGERYRSYVEQVARRELNLVYPGETVVLVQWRDPPPSAGVVPATPAPTPQPNWRRWLEFLRLTGG